MTHFIEYDVRTGEHITKEIPNADFYVVSEDKGMSDWGPSKGKRNFCVVPCSDHTMSCLVGNYVLSRGDQSNVRIVKTKPKKKPDVVYSLMARWGELAMRDAFKE